MSLSISKLEIIFQSQRFENHWLDFDGFYDTVKLAWESAPIMHDIGKIINAKFKRTRYSLKKWSKRVSNLKEIISNCQYTLALLDGIEEQRSLSIIENFFRKIVEIHTRKMLEAKRIYWKSRAKIKWAKLGDENTKFFHTVATQQYRRNIITSLKASDGTNIFNHDNKASIIWSSFKYRLGISEESPMLMDLSSIVQSHDLSHLDNHFTKEEIATVIKEMPIDKAPGPVGFNGKFLKKCWHLVKEDFMKLVNDFYEGNLQLESINTAYITLITKNNNP
jgi:hypothetical protein